MTTHELVSLIRQVDRQPIERDSLYNELKDYTEVEFDEGPKSKSLYSSKCHTVEA